MNFYVIWPYFACLATLLVIVSTPVFKVADNPPLLYASRVLTLDGLRGFLAVNVFFHHAAIYYQLIHGGGWGPPPSRFYAYLGHVGVGPFFMITGYLFWSRLIAERGKPNWQRLYIGRIFRIGPLYELAIALMMLIIFVRTRFQLHVPVELFIAEIVMLLSLGLFPMIVFNGYGATNQILAGVTWSLQFEWYFYFSLPLTAIAARHALTHLPFSLISLVISILWLSLYPSDFMKDHVCVLALFLVGMTTASLEKHNLMARLPDRVASALVLALVTCLFASSGSNATLCVALLGAAFFLIASGCTAFNLLTCRSARRLGEISYGIYLFQGLVLTVVFSLDFVRSFAMASPLQYWETMCFCLILLVSVATIMHVCVERPGIELGKWVAACQRK